MSKRSFAVLLIFAVITTLINSCIANRPHPNTNGSGWRDLFNEDFSNAVFKPGSWEIKTGRVIEAMHDELFWTKEQYGDFILDLEFKFGPDANSGVLLRTGDLVDWIQTGIEVQVRDSHDQTEFNKYECGAIFDILEPSKKAVKQAGEWNRFTITMKASKIRVVLNGVKVLDMNLNDWTEAHKNPDGTKNKFRTAYKDMPRRGHIGFQGLHGGAKIWYRNIRIKPL